MPLTRTNDNDPKTPEEGVEVFLRRVLLDQDPQVTFHVMLMRRCGLDGAEDRRWVAFIELPSGRIEVRHSVHRIRRTGALWSELKTDVLPKESARVLWVAFSDEKTWTKSYRPISSGSQ